MSDTKGEPLAGEVIVSDVRTARVKLSNCPRVVDPQTGYTFVPDGLYMEWHNGRLVHCTLVGPRLRPDGGTFLDDRRTGRSFVRRLFPPFVMDDDTPEWVRRMVVVHGPHAAAHDVLDMS